MVYLYSGILFDHKKEVLVHFTTWMNLDNIILSQRGCHKRPHKYDSIYIKCVKEAYLQKQSRTVVFKGRGIGKKWNSDY